MRVLVNDEPENLCFDCSPHNPVGLQLVFRVHADRAVECRIPACDHWQGVPGVIHGGIQAALLDEAMGMAVHAARDTGMDRPFPNVATADLQLRYRRPAPTTQPLRVRARVERREGRSIFVRGEIVDARDELLTSATARWVEIEPAPT